MAGRIVVDDRRSERGWDRFTLRFEDGALLLLDQRALPETERWIRCETVEEVAEPFLVRAGLLARTPRGRVATPGAWRHLGLAVPPRSPFGGLPPDEGELDLFTGTGV